MTQAADNGLHQAVERNIAEGVEHAIVGRLHHERRAKGMMGEARQRHVIALDVNAPGKLLGSVAHAKHEERGRKVTYLAVEHEAETRVEHAQAPRGARHLHGGT